MGNEPGRGPVKRIGIMWGGGLGRACYQDVRPVLHQKVPVGPPRKNAPMWWMGQKKYKRGGGAYQPARGPAGFSGRVCLGVHPPPRPLRGQSWRNMGGTAGEVRGGRGGEALQKKG